MHWVASDADGAAATVPADSPFKSFVTVADRVLGPVITKFKKSNRSWEYQKKCPVLKVTNML